LIFIFSPIFSGDLQNSIRSFFPEKILLEFSDEGYKGLDVTRFGIYSSALKLIKSAPFFGIGAGSFPPIYFLETNFWKGHTHNLLLELSISYGIPITIIFFIAIITILFLSSKTIFINKNISQISLIDKAIWASLFFFLLSQLVDIQYLEGRISIIVWILIASLKNIIETRIEKINLKK
jgi:O-antigen ligase